MSRPAWFASLPATGIGSWPGESALEAATIIRDQLGDGLAYLPELPARGVGADMIGRTLALMVELPAEVHAGVWRMASHPGKDLRRGQSWWRHDLADLAQVFSGHSGPIKVAVTGPWTMAATVELASGEKMVSDLGACADLTASLAEGVRRLRSEFAGLIPHVPLVIQVDEPALPSVLAGQIPNQSGLRRLDAPHFDAVRQSLTLLAEACGDDPILHSCHPGIDIDLVAQAGFTGLSVDLTLASAQQWERIAARVEAGATLLAGVVPTSGPVRWKSSLEALVMPWQRIGLSEDRLTQVLLSPTCGLARSADASARQACVIEAAHALAERITG